MLCPLFIYRVITLGTADNRNLRWSYNTSLSKTSQLSTCLEHYQFSAKIAYQTDIHV